MVSFTGASIAEDSPRIFIFLLLLLICLLCPWSWVPLGTRVGLICRSKLHVTNARLGQSLSKSSFLPLLLGQWDLLLCLWLQTPLVRFLHLLWLHIFGVALDLSPEILDLFLKLQTPHLQLQNPYLSQTPGQACPWPSSKCVGDGFQKCRAHWMI